MVPKHKSPPSALFKGIRDVFQYPPELCSRKVRINDQSCSIPNVLFQSFLAQLLAKRGRSSALPDNGIHDGLAGLPFPYYRRLTLVRNTDCSDFRWGRPVLRHYIQTGRLLTFPDFERVMFNPPRFGINLLEFKSTLANDFPLSIYQEGL